MTATGGVRAAGIGGGTLNDGTYITITGGTVTAKSTSNGSNGCGAGIGGGWAGSGYHIIISGGTVTATGVTGGAGIGGGDYNSSYSDSGIGSNITISGGYITATAGTDAAAIGAGRNGSSSNISITGGYFGDSSYTAGVGSEGIVYGVAVNAYSAVIANTGSSTYPCYVTASPCAFLDLTAGKLIMNVYVNSDSYYAGGTLSSTIGGEAPYHAVTVTDDSANDRYIISQKILPTQMAEDIVFTIPLSDGSTYAYTTSIKDYANAVTDEDEKAALTAMLDYGSAVQELAGETDAEKLANGGTYQEFTADELNTLTNYSKSISPTDWIGASLASMNMNFNYNFNLGMSYSASLTDGCTITATLGGETYTVTTLTDPDEDISNSIVIENLTAFDLVKELVVTLDATDPDGSQSTYTATLSPMYYVKLLATSDDATEAQQKVGQMLYKYVMALSALTTE